jgi:hypothetical protein
MPVGSVAGYIDESDKFNEDGTVKFLDKPAPPGRRYMPEFELEFLKNEGSVAAPAQPAEGIVIFHIATGSLFKATVDNDAAHKFEVVGANVGR